MPRHTHSAHARIAATAFAVAIPLAAVAVGSHPLHAAAGGQTRLISAGGTTSFAGANTADTTTGVQNPETPGSPGSDAGPADRSHSAGGGGTSPGAISQPTPVTSSTPGLLTSFDGINHFQQRFGSPNQFSLEPPDQGLCVGTDGNGNTRIVETVNDTIRVYTTAGTALTSPKGLNAFFNYNPAIIRSPHVVFGPFVTDPSCLFDAATGRWFVNILTIDTFPSPGSDGLQHFKGTNHLDIAVSDTSDPTGSWTIWHVSVQDDGTTCTSYDATGCATVGPGPVDHHCSAGTDTATPLPTNPHACLGDYPHIGSDANGFYVTTNEYSLFGNEFHGAQVYAMSKPGLESGPGGTATVTQFDTHGMDSFGFALNGFTLWPSTTPGGGGDPTAGGTEYFLSSNAAAEAHDTGDGKSTAHPSTQLLVWALTNTGSLGGSPALSLSNTKLDVGLYAPPPPAEQKAGNQPLRDCLNSNPCNLVLEGAKDPFAEKASGLDSNDTRMQQVTWVNGKLWGALDTALATSNTKQAGIEWFTAAPSTATGSVTSTLANAGYVGLGNDNLTYPAIGITSGGTGVMAFTVVGSDFYPSAGYALVSAAGVGAVHVAAAGAGPEDGFSDYRFFANPPNFTPRPRWGDYGAAVPMGSNVWIASEYIGQSCDFSTWKATNFRCNNTRTALANWDTRISEVSAP